MADGVEGSAVAFSWFLVEHRSMLDCPENSRPPPISLSHRGVIPTESAVADGVEGSAVAFIVSGGTPFHARLRLLFTACKGFHFIFLGGLDPGVELWP